MHTKMVVPPYGVMWSDFERHGQQLDEAPARWCGGAASYKPWVTGMIDTLAASFWPRYQDGWVGDTSNLWPLLELELELVDRLQSRFLDVPALDGPAPTHAMLFREEDEGNFARTLLACCGSLLPLQKELTRVAEAAAPERLHVMDLHLKHPFQRPRPYQAARLLGRTLRHEYALWAFTPALVSGHALEGALVGACVYEWLLANHPGSAHAAEADLQQWCMDVGDRRVMAGVHYPTDGAASYVALLSAAPHLFAGDPPRRFLADALRHRSRSYKLLEATVNAGGVKAEVLAAPWHALQQALAGAAAAAKHEAVGACGEGREPASAKHGAVGPGHEGRAPAAADAAYSVAEVRRKHQRRALAA
jgi:hypothetical protein